MDAGRKYYWAVKVIFPTVGDFIVRVTAYTTFPKMSRVHEMYSPLLSVTT